MKPLKRIQLVVWALLATVAATCAGCAEGPLWRSGKYAPWVQKQWAAEEQLADTQFAKKRRMTDLVSQVQNGSVEDKDRAAQQLYQDYFLSSTLLTRLQAIKLISELDCPTTQRALQAASIDPNMDIRLAAVQGWRRQPQEHAVPALRSILENDRQVDVRLAATRALGDFPGSPTADALRSALSDPDPAIQLRAMESLARATGESWGRDIAAWKRYLGDERMAQQPLPNTGLSR